MSSTAHPARQRAATIWLLSMTVIWGSTFFVTKITIDAANRCPSAKDVDPALAPVLLQLLRFALSAIFFPICFPRTLKELTGPSVRAGFWLAFSCVAGCLLQGIGLGITTPALSAFLTSLAVLFTPLVVWVWTREVPSARLIGAVALAILGLSLLTSTGGGGWGKGETLCLFCALFFGMQIVMIDRFMKSAPLLGTTWLQLVLAIPLVLVIIPFFHGAEALVKRPWLVEMAQSPKVAWPLVYLSALGTVLALYICNRFQKDIDPTRAAVIYTLEPLFAAIFSWGFWGERFTAWMVAGGLILVGGNLVAELGKDRKLEPVPAET